MTLICNDILFKAPLPSAQFSQPLDPDDISVIVPVKDNQAGINIFIANLLASHPRLLPREVIIVDNNSRYSVELSPFAAWDHCLRARTSIIRCTTPGPAAARNAGAAIASAPWLLFADADCIPTASFLTGYASAADGSIAYAGKIRAVANDPISRYYESQGILCPRALIDVNGVRRPAYLITANALVNAEAFQAVGGFNEAFASAAGEDVDLGLRLWKVGSLAFAEEALVFHDFEPDLKSFQHRFERYGAGNRQLSILHGLDLTPGRFRPEEDNPLNRQLAEWQYLSLLRGYSATEAHRHQRPTMSFMTS